MAIIKCKMCGGDLHFEEGASICECEYCGNTNTLPVVSSDQEMNLFNRANHFRMINEFDKAISAYEKILDTDVTNAEAHWGIVLSRYGIEYVEDPVSHERIPTCHRVQLTSILSDPDYLAAVEHADSIASAEYKVQAERIAQIQKRILAISSQEKPYEVFICYKESDDNGNRTVDSTLAQDIYYGLTESGYRVFFSRITLEDKLGQEYEPYIFAALNSAKVMVVVGTKPEYFNAVWVKNEWSRYLDLMKNDRHRLLIPCYRDMDPYDLPDELSMLQSQDMGKIGFMQDLLRGIRKVLAKDTDKPAAKETVIVQQQPAAGTTANVQVKRGNMALEDHDWAKADGFFEEALNLDPECAEAYLGKLLAQKRQVNWAAFIKVLEKQYEESTSEKLEACPEDTGHIEDMIRKYSIKDYVAEGDIRKLYDYDRSFFSILSCRKSQKEKQEKEVSAERLLNRVKQYAKGETKQQIDDSLDGLMAVLDQRISKAMEEDQASIARVKADYAAHIEAADKKAEELFADGQNRREQRYQENAASMKSAKDVPAFERTRDALKKMDGYKDSDELAEKCQREIDRLKEEKQREEERQAALRRAEAERASRKKKTIAAIAGFAAIACVAAVIIVTQVIIPNNKYKAAVAAMNAGDYITAYESFEEMNGMKDSDELQKSIKAEYKEALFSNIEVGSKLFFGTYEQNNDTSDGKEDIEWIVLEKKETSVLLISKFALDCKPYNEVMKDITWEECTLRGWLNETFIDEAFSEDEKGMILTTTVKANSNPEYSTDPGHDTSDQVFLLSIQAAEAYFSSDEERQCKETPYAKSQANSSLDEAYWWLRSPGKYSVTAARVMADGSISNGGCNVNFDTEDVRPALWINLDS